MADQASGGVLSPWLQRRRISRARPYLRGCVLDFGCGNGALAAFCRPEAYLGIDADDASLATARRLHPGYVFSGDVDREEPFDTIAALAVIEHVPEPADLLTRFRNWMVPGGRIVLTTPHPTFEWFHTVGARVGAFSREAHEEHETLLDRPRMEALARASGLAIERFERFLMGANQLFVLRRVA